VRKACRIRIIDTPPGEAPEEIRRAWIGIELDSWSGRKQNRGFGVLTGPKTLFRLLFTFRGEAMAMDGYGVFALRAFEELAKHNPAAEKWWRENAGHLYRKGMGLVFDAGACQELE